MSQVRFPGDGNFIFQIAQNLFPYMAEPAVSLFFFFLTKGISLQRKLCLEASQGFLKYFTSQNSN